jgi:hypothetical protein
MSETYRPRHIGRSIGAVLVTGIVARIILTTSVDVVLHAIDVFPPWDQPIASYLRRPIAPSTASPAALSRRASHRTGPCSTPWRAALWPLP